MGRRFARLVGLIAAAMLLLPGVLAASAQQATPEAEASALDLAAMVLTPVDLDDLGMSDFVIADGQSQTLEDRVDEQEAAGSNPANVRANLQDLGWIRGYRSRLAHADTVGSDDFDALISSGVTQYADEEGATQGWNLASLLDVTSGEADFIERDVTIGDESRLIDTGTLQFGDNQDHPGLRLVFRAGTLVGDLIVFGVPDVAIDPADIEALAARQLEQMEAVATGAGPGLSLKVLRWQGIGFADPDIDNYLKLDDDAFIGLGDDEQDIEQSENTYADAIDHYRYEAALTESLFQYTSIVSFPDAETAAEWVSGALDRTEENRPPDSTLKEVTDAPTFGDSSVVLTATVPVQGSDATGHVVFVQFGDEVVSVSLFALGGLDVDNVIAMAEAQVACYEANDCLESVPVPSWVNA